MSSPRLADAVRVLARLSRLLHRADSGLSLPQYRLLSAIDAGSERSSCLAARLAVTKPTVTALVDNLVAAGNLTRCPDPTDGRACRLRVTEAGRAALHHANEVFTERLAPVVAQVSDPEALVGLLTELGDVLDRRTGRGPKVVA